MEPGSKSTTCLLNSPVLTGYGEWTFEGPVSVERARDVLKRDFVSAIGHQGTADLLRVLLRVDVSANCIWAEKQPGDLALVVRLLERVPEGKVLSAEQRWAIPYELGILSRVR
jgi:hypothetical protein